MSANAWAVVVAVVSLAVAGTAAFYTYRQTRHLAGSGFKTAEDLKVDIVALLAALRSVIYKGIAASQDDRSRDVSSELERLRDFQTSPSGYALGAFAAERGSGTSEDAGRWRVLGLQFAELCGLVIPATQADGSLVLRARHWATEIETTLGSLTAQDVDWMAAKVGNLPSMVASLVETRSRDMVANLWFGVAAQRRDEADPQAQLGRLQKLKLSGIDDPDLDLWIATLTDDTALLAKALGDGADTSITLGGLLERYDDVDADGAG